MQGAIIKSNKIYLNDQEIYSDCKLIGLKWTKSDRNENKKIITLPVYLNSQRTELLFRIDIECAENENIFYEKGVAFISSTIGF